MLGLSCQVNSKFVDRNLMVDTFIANASADECVFSIHAKVAANGDYIVCDPLYAPCWQLVPLALPIHLRALHAHVFAKQMHGLLPTLMPFSAGKQERTLPSRLHCYLTRWQEHDLFMELEWASQVWEFWPQ